MSPLRDQEEAPNFLERVFAKGWGKRDSIKHDPDYDTLRDDTALQKTPRKSQMIVAQRSVLQLTVACRKLSVS